LRNIAKFAGAAVAFCVILISASFAYVAWLAHLPSDKQAEAFYHTHRRELAALVATVEHDPRMNFVTAEWAGAGSTPEDPGHVACAKLLKRLGAKFLRRRDGGIEIYLWGANLSASRDSYEGYAFIPPDAPAMHEATVARSLESKALPTGQRRLVETGRYIRPLDENWYMIRWERE
jgi:hypothetical protein